uniref:Helper of transposition of an IS21 family member, ORFA n=1 Tax=mine drainage metagenome TaxID=410659 RepID=E6QHB6_9ZZZZ
MNAPLLEEHLRSLRLPAMLANYRRISKDDDALIAYLGELAALEVGKRHENGVRGRIALAKFPVIKTIEAFDFSLQPTFPKVKLLELLSCEFIKQRRNLVFIGPTGVGKTHLLSAIGFAACTHGYRVLFSTAAELLMSLIKAKREDRLRQRLETIDRYDFLLVDELGYIPFEREATDLLFQVITRRYERKSIGITTNLAFPDWVQVFPSENATGAVVDRLIHHGTVFELDGESHRLRSRKKAVGTS